jgi:pilus assembly protein CpaC
MTHRPRFHRLAIAAAALCLTPWAPLEARAEQVAHGVYGSPGAGGAAGVYANPTPPVAHASEELNVGNGRLIRLAAPAAGVFIGDPTVADVQVKSPTLVYVLGRNLGETTLIAVDQHDATIANVSISVGYNLSQLRQELHRMAPDADIEVTMANKAIVLSGAVASAGEAETAKQLAARYVAEPDNLVNLLRVDAPNQVNLRVRVVEVSRDIIKAFGINWTGVGQTGNWAIGGITGAGGLTASGAGAVANNIATQVPGLSGLASLFAQYKAGSTTINSVIDALDSEGLVTVLAEPNITAVSGASANFLAGGEYPIPVPQGLGQVTIEFKKYGVSLDSVATIVDGDRIHLTVRPEVSQLSTQGEIILNGVQVPALTTRRAETTVDLASGQSFAIAGLLNNTVNHAIQKVPGLGNVKVLAPLFKSDRFERSETELLIIVTPYIVRPSSHRLAVPTDGYIAPTDPDRMLHGADYTQAKKAGPPPPQEGPVKVVQP